GSGRGHYRPSRHSGDFGNTGPNHHPLRGRLRQVGPSPGRGSHAPGGNGRTSPRGGGGSRNRGRDRPQARGDGSADRRIRGGRREAFFGPESRFSGLGPVETHHAVGGHGRPAQRTAAHVRSDRFHP